MVHDGDIPEPLTGVICINGARQDTGRRQQGEVVSLLWAGKLETFPYAAALGI
jgi:hypothetical protein